MSANDARPCRSPSSGWSAIARPRSVHCPLRRRRLRWCRHPRSSLKWPGRLLSAGDGGPSDSPPPIVPSHFKPFGPASPAARFVGAQPGRDRAGAHISHRSSRFHFNPQRRETACAGGCDARSDTGSPATARRRRRRVRSNVDTSQEQKCVTDAGLSAGRRAPHD